MNLRRALMIGAVLTPLAAAADSAAWTPLIGAWRTADYVSCGVDDVRAGRITSVGEKALLIGHIVCVIEQGVTSADGAVISIGAECDLGGGYMTRLDYEWRLQGPDEVLLEHLGYERRLVRCRKGVE